MSNTTVLKANKVMTVVSSKGQILVGVCLQFINVRMTWRVCVNFFKECQLFACPRIGILFCCNALDACGSWKLTLFIEVYNADDNILHLSRRPCATQICWKHIKQQTVSLLVEYLLYSVISPLNNQTSTLRSVPCAPINLSGIHAKYLIKKQKHNSQLKTETMLRFLFI